MDEPVDVLVNWLAVRLELPAAVFAECAGRPQTMTDYARILAATLGLRAPSALDWLESPELRRRCHAGLNKSEQRHFLAQVICTFKQGRIADRGMEVQQFRASGLNLVIAAIVYWNSTA